MSDTRKRNHYIARSYLKAWCNVNGKVQVYYTLVPTEKMKLWVEKTTKAIGYQEHLFTNTVTGQESDEIERWMAEDIEGPAQVALNKIRNKKNLSDAEWLLLLRYVALHDTRTPLRYIQSCSRMRKETPNIIKDTLKEVFGELSINKGPASRLLHKFPASKDMLPVRLTVKDKSEPDTKDSYLEVRTVVGRGMWLTSLQHILNSTYHILIQHHWNIITAPEGVEWITSDNPVVKLNYNNIIDFDLNGGWNSPGTEIIFPLSPHYLLYTKVGEMLNVDHCSERIANKLLFFIAKNANRHIYAAKPADMICKLRQREVDQDKYNTEQEVWKSFNCREKAAENKLV